MYFIKKENGYYEFKKLGSNENKNCPNGAVSILKKGFYCALMV